MNIAHYHSTALEKRRRFLCELPVPDPAAGSTACPKERELALAGDAKNAKTMSATLRLPGGARWWTTFLSNRKSRFSEIWNGSEYTALREAHLNGNPPKIFDCCY